jgi:hypothetical protein
LSSKLNHKTANIFFIKIQRVDHIHIKKKTQQLVVMATSFHFKTKATILAHRWLIRHSVQLNI